MLYYVPLVVTIIMDRKKTVLSIETILIASVFLGACDMVSARNTSRIKKSFSLDKHPLSGLVVRSCNVDADCNPGIAHPDRFTSFCRNKDGITFQPGFDGPVGGGGGSCSK